MRKVKIKFMHTDHIILWGQQKLSKMMDTRERSTCAFLAKSANRSDGPLLKEKCPSLTYSNKRHVVRTWYIFSCKFELCRHNKTLFQFYDAPFLSIRVANVA